VYGQKPREFAANIGCQSQYDRGKLASADASRAFALIALKPSPGGIINPF
jgi:hypothetical protein